MCICGYHHTRSNGFTFYGWSRKNKLVELDDPGKRLMLGIENEISFRGDDRYNTEDISDELGDAVGDYIGIERDGSVDYGFETVSMPMTINAHVKSDWIDKLCETVNEHDAIDGRNGIHIHVSRAGLGQTRDAQDLAIAKMALMLERHEYNFIRLARRDYPNSSWAGRVYCSDSAAHSDTLSQKVKAANTYRYQSINLTNRNTVEIRIFAGSVVVSTIKATLELVHALATFCMTKTLNEVRDGEWSDFKAYCTSGKYTFLPDYMTSVGV